MPRIPARARVDEPFFQQRYEADAANKARQSWKEHQDWVRTFYEGKRFPPVAGWRERERDLVARAPGAREQVERVGRLLASEWAKDNAVRKVSTSDLQAWGKRFSDAAKEPAALVAALTQVEEEMRKRGVA